MKTARIIITNYPYLSIDCRETLGEGTDMGHGTKKLESGSPHYRIQDPTQ